MTVLSLETATAVCAAAVVNNTRTLSERSRREPHIHSQKLVTLIDEVMNEASVDSNSIGGIAVSIGPGSFTGLRIGLSVAKGLAYAWGKPLVAVPTLEALALNVLQQNINRTDDMILSIIDARRNDVYACCYRVSGGVLQEVFSSRAMTLGQLIELDEPAQQFVVTGDAVNKFKTFVETLHPQHARRFRFLSDEQSRCSASSVGVIGWQKLSRKEFADVATIEPLYVKEFQTMLQTQHTAVH